MRWGQGEDRAKYFFEWTLELVSRNQDEKKIGDEHVSTADKRKENGLLIVQTEKKLGGQKNILDGYRWLSYTMRPEDGCPNSVVVFL